MLVCSILKNSNQNIQPKMSKYQISFKQVTPEHFFVRMRGYNQNKTWGQSMVNLVDMYKSTILNGDSEFNSVFYKMGKKYRGFKVKNPAAPSQKPQESFCLRVISKTLRAINGLLSGTIGAKKHFYNLDLLGLVRKNEKGKYSEYYDVIKEKLESNKQNLRPAKKIIFVKTKIGKSFMPFPKIVKLDTWQVQEKVDGKNVILTRVARLPKSIDEKILCFIHPPIRTRKVVLNHAQKIFELLKEYNGKKLTKGETSEIYQKIGEIHWCLTQSMPFCHGSAGIADAFVKSIFENLNIQTTPWKRGLAPDIEAFFTPLAQFSKKYQSFFDDVTNV